jgi:opacity protein-like surface antigen
MKRIIPFLALAICVAAMAEAATTPVSKSTTTAKSASTPNAAQTTSRTATKATKTTSAAVTAPRAKATTRPAPAPQAESDSPGHMNLGLRAIGGSLGFVSPENSDGTYTLGAFADCGRITPNIMLEPHLDYWSKSEESFGAKASIRDVILGAHAKYMFETTSSSLQPFLGAGLGLHFLHAEATIPVPGFPSQNAEDSSTKLGLDIGGGVSTPIGLRSNLGGDVWYGIVSDVSQFSMRLGMSYRLGQ